MDKRLLGNAAGIDVDDIVVRPAEADDVEQIGAMWKKLVAYHRDLDDRLPTADENGDKFYARRIVERLDDTHSRTFVAEHAGQLIGFTLGVIVDMVPEMFLQETGGFLADIFVEEAYRRHGVGYKLVESLAEWFQSRGVVHMEWYVAARNESARQFWLAVSGRDVMIRMRLEL
jgi:GNAT superfamily N-acetyltransferase